MLEKMAKKKKAELLPYMQQSKNSKHTTRPITAALEDRYFPAAGLKVPLYPDFFEEQANVMQTKLCMKRSMI